MTDSMVSLIKMCAVQYDKCIARSGVLVGSLILRAAVLMASIATLEVIVFTFSSRHIIAIAPGIATSKSKIYVEEPYWGKKNFAKNDFEWLTQYVIKQMSPRI